MKNNIIKKELYIKKISCSSINTTSSYKKYVSNKYYSSILYLLIKKGFTYFGELKGCPLIKMSTFHYLDNLENAGIIIKRSVSIEEKEIILALKKRIPKDILNNLQVYTFTESGENIFTKPELYDLIRIFSIEGLNEYLILQKNKYEQIVMENKRKEEHKDFIYRMKMKNIGARGY